MAIKKNPGKRGRRRARTLGDVAQGLIDPALRKRGFANSSLISDWTVIVPPPYDTALIPFSLRWPRHRAGGHPNGPGAPEDRSNGATLFVRVDPAHALTFAHEERVVRDAINRYFGFYLVAAIRPAKTAFAAAAPAEKPAIHPPSPCPPTPGLKTITDKQLRGALEELGSRIAGRDRQVQK
jgi:hypothetical protein